MTSLLYFALRTLPLRWLCSCFSWENTSSAWIFTAVYCCACRPYWCPRGAFSFTNDRKRAHRGNLSRSANTFENIISQSHEIQKCWNIQKRTPPLINTFVCRNGNKQNMWNLFYYISFLNDATLMDICCATTKKPISNIKFPSTEGFFWPTLLSHLF